MRPDYRVNGVPCYEIESEEEIKQIPKHLRELATIGKRNGKKVVAHIPRYM